MKKTIIVSGMHCKSCELLIKEGVNNISGCVVESISHKKGNLVVDIKDVDKISEIEKIIIYSGYKIGPDINKKISLEKIIENISWLLFAIFILRLALESNIANVIPNYTNLTFGIAIVVGLVASISTCLAVTGGIIVGYAESVQTKNNIGTQIKFHIGRIISFIIGGMLLGIIGKGFQSTLWINIILSILVGLVLLYLGLQLLGFLPNISKLGFHLPGWLSKGIFTIKNPKYAGFVGALTFLLPCGFTQSMQLFALQSGSGLQGAMIMGAFALGTLPVLLGLGLGTKYIKDKITFLNPLIASLLVIFGSYTLYNGYNIINAFTTQSGRQTAMSNNLETETVQVGFDGSYFVPRNIVLKKGKNYILNVTPSSDGFGCKSQVIIPGKGAHTIKKGEQFQIFVDGSKPGSTKLVCASMGMPEGEIIIE